MVKVHNPRVTRLGEEDKQIHDEVTAVGKNFLIVQELGRWPRENIAEIAEGFVLEIATMSAHDAVKFLRHKRLVLTDAGLINKKRDQSYFYTPRQ